MLWRGDPCPIPGAMPGMGEHKILLCDVEMGEGVKQLFNVHENWFLLPTYMHAGASSTPQYAYSPVGLFPCPVGPSTRFSIVEEVCSKFRFLGKFMAKAIMDSRMVSVSECVCASLQLGPGRLCPNFKYNRLSILVRIMLE